MFESGRSQVLYEVHGLQGLGVEAPSTISITITPGAAERIGGVGPRMSTPITTTTKISVDRANTKSGALQYRLCEGGLGHAPSKTF